MSAAYDCQAEQYLDQALRLRAAVDRLVEMHTLIECCADCTWLTNEDIEDIAHECGVRSEYLQALNHTRTGAST